MGLTRLRLWAGNAYTSLKAMRKKREEVHQIVKAGKGSLERKGAGMRLSTDHQRFEGENK